MRTQNNISVGTFSKLHSVYLLFNFPTTADVTRNIRGHRDIVAGLTVYCATCFSVSKCLNIMKISTFDTVYKCMPY